MLRAVPRDDHERFPECRVLQVRGAQHQFAGNGDDIHLAPQIMGYAGQNLFRHMHGAASFGVEAEIWSRSSLVLLQRERAFLVEPV